MHIVDHIDDAIAIAVIFFFGIADRKEQLESRACLAAIDHLLCQSRALDGIGIAAVRSQPEGRRKRPHAPEQFGILPAEVEGVEPTQRPAEDGACVGHRARPVVRVDQGNQRLCQPFGICVGVCPHRSVARPGREAALAGSIGQPIRRHPVRRHVDGHHDRRADAAVAAQCAQGFAHCDGFHVLAIVDVQHRMADRRVRAIRRWQQHAHPQRRGSNVRRRCHLQRLDRCVRCHRRRRVHCR